MFIKIYHPHFDYINTCDSPKDISKYFYESQHPIFFSFILVKNSYSSQKIIGRSVETKDYTISSEKYGVYDYRTFIKFNLTITRDYIKTIITLGKVEILEYLHKTNKLKPEFTTDVLGYVSIKGNINILNWWKNSGLPWDYSKSLLNSASYYGHIDVLTWFLNSGLELKYDEAALRFASQQGHINVLNWWFKSGLELKFDTHVSYYHQWHIDVINCWKNAMLDRL